MLVILYLHVIGTLRLHHFYTYYIDQVFPEHRYLNYGIGFD